MSQKSSTEVSIGSSVCDRYSGSCGRIVSITDDEVLMEPTVIRRGPQGEYLETTEPVIKARINNLEPDHIKRYVEIPSNHELLFHFGVEEAGSPGAVIDEGVAKSSPCSCFTYNGKDMCWSKGIVGILSQDQQEVYCIAGKTYQARPALTARYEKFAEAAGEAHKKIETMPKGMPRLEAWLQEMGKELSTRGIEV